jgi:UDP:flavonoid glycosyltransferase YjiC (YdhE family)
MARIVLAAFGSLGDLHPLIAIALELRSRGHDVSIAAMEYYREKIESIGIAFLPMAPHMVPGDEEKIASMMDAKTGPEVILREIIIPNLRPMYDDLMKAVEGADALISGEIVYSAQLVAEKTGIPHITTTMAPLSMFSIYDPGVPPQAPWFESLRFLGPLFNRGILALAKMNLDPWFAPYRAFRTDLGLDPNFDPLFSGKFSTDLHLVLFSSVLGAPQRDWPASAVQTGFCFYDGQADSGTMPDGLEEFIAAGEAPIVFTLGSAAVMDAGEFFNDSVKAAKLLGRRAVMIYGRDNPPPQGLADDIVGFEYAPYSLVFRHAACVVHQGGVGTTGQVLRAGIPHVFMPYGHDQPDNAARCRRIGVAEIVGRKKYTAETSAAAVHKVLSLPGYSASAAGYAGIVQSEKGAAAAADAIEHLLNK